MNKNEFEQRIGKTVNQSEYEIIEKVYTWHPAISNVSGKDQIADLYKNFGMSVIRGMVPVADKMIEIDEKKRELRAQMELLEQREELLSEGDMTLEEAIIKVNDMFMKAETEEKFEQMMKACGIEECFKDAARKANGI